MIKNNKGFSIVELLAMIMITTVLIYPLMQSLVKNVEINERLHLRQSATSISRTALYGLEKLPFDTLSEEVRAVENTAYFIELNGGAGGCDILDSIANPEDEYLCNEIFGLVENNFEPDETQFRVFVYNYFLSSQQYTKLTEQTSYTDLPKEVQDQILLLGSSTEIENGLLRVTVWVEYNDPPYYVVLSGVLFE